MIYLDIHNAHFTAFNQYSIHSTIDTTTTIADYAYAIHSPQLNHRITLLASAMLDAIADDNSQNISRPNPDSRPVFRSLSSSFLPCEQ